MAEDRGRARRDRAAATLLGLRLGGGQALARYVLDHPETVAGRRVLDVATGPVSSPSPRRRRARPRSAIDIDAFCEVAVGLNAEANGVAITAMTGDAIGRDAGFDVILAGDVCYERSMTATMMAWLQPLAKAGRTVLIGDPAAPTCRGTGTI